MSFVVVDLLARLHLAARRRGVELRIREADPELRELISLAGLDSVLGVDVLRVEQRRQAEERKELLGVEEERELRDPPA